MMEEYGRKPYKILAGRIPTVVGKREACLYGPERRVRRVVEQDWSARRPFAIELDYVWGMRTLVSHILG